MPIQAIYYFIVTQKSLIFVSELRKYAALTVFNDNSTRLAYRKNCQRDILFYYGMINKETERLLVRKITRKDMDALLAIMAKPEVMYAWEHDFTPKDVRKWINRQLTRYSKDGFGYFAVILKANNTLIGQAGLMKSTINGNEVVELGYILDNKYWHNGYGIEAARVCLEYAFGELGLKTVCCSIRPENGASIRVAEKLGMSLCGRHTVIYNDKEMLHLIYELKANNQ